MKEKKFRFFQHKKCEYFPCHATNDKKGFNCLMCYCPLYFLPDCGGAFTLLKSGLKDCTNCTLPHFHYDLVQEKLNRVFEERERAAKKSTSQTQEEVPPWTDKR